MLKAMHEPSFLTQATTASGGDHTIKNLYSKKQGASYTDNNNIRSGRKLYEDYRSGADGLYNSKHPQKQSEPQLRTAASNSKPSNLSPGRLARPLKKKGFQASQVYEVSPDRRKKQLDDSMAGFPDKRERSHDANFMRKEPEYPK